MKKKKNFSFLVILFLIAFSFIASGDCDIDFGSDSNGNGNNGGGTTTSELVQGTITNIIPDRSIGGITVRIEDEDSIGTPFETITDNNGFFRITGNFTGLPLSVDFLADTNATDQTLTLLGSTSVSVFPNADVLLGDIRIDNGSVILDNDTVVIFEGNVTQVNCTTSPRTLQVTADNTLITVNIISSTAIRRNGSSINCEDVFSNDQAEVTGILISNDTVEASRIAF